MDFLNTQIPEEFRTELFESIRTANKVSKYRMNYCQLNEKEQRMEFNQLASNCEIYRNYIQREVYQNALTVCTEISRNELFETSELQLDITPLQQLSAMQAKQTFEQKMKHYVELKELLEREKLNFNLALENTVKTMERENDSLRIFYREIGPQKIKALEYREQKLQDELHFRTFKQRVSEQIRKQFPEGEMKTAKQWKEALREIYEKLVVKHAPKMSDLEKLYGFTLKKHHLTGEDGKRYYSYELLNI